MSTYAELTARLQQTVENEFSPDQLAGFFRMAEEKIYQAALPPVMQKVSSLPLLAGTKDLTLPTDFLHMRAVFTSDGVTGTKYLVEADPTYLNEAYPDPTYEGVPRTYALLTDTTLRVAPTPATDITVSLDYAAYPESIVTAGETWLSRTFDQVLLNAAMLEAARFMKAEQDMVALYDKLLEESLVLYRRYADVKLKRDVYRDRSIIVGAAQ